jgi:hypothetical protein
VRKFSFLPNMLPREVLVRLDPPRPNPLYLSKEAFSKSLGLYVFPGNRVGAGGLC